MARYESREVNGATIITPTHLMQGLPKVETYVKADGSEACLISIAVDGEIIAMATIWRGKAFAVEVAKRMLMACLSRLGKHRRLTANKAKRVAGETPPLLGHPLGGQPSAGGYSLPVRGVAI